MLTDFFAVIRTLRNTPSFTLAALAVMVFGGANFAQTPPV